MLLVTSLILNAVIVFPVSVAMLTGQAGMETVFGPQSPARQILASVYLAIGLVSVVALAGLAFGYSSLVVPMAVGLLIMQVGYKLISVGTVGLGNPVVLTNLLVVAVHCVTLAVWARQTFT